mgnify:CR=1
MADGVGGRVECYHRNTQTLNIKDAPCRAAVPSNGTIVMWVLTRLFPAHHHVASAACLCCYPESPSMRGFFCLQE